MFVSLYVLNLFPYLISRPDATTGQQPSEELWITELTKDSFKACAMTIQRVSNYYTRAATVVANENF